MMVFLSYKLFMDDIHFSSNISFAYARHYDIRWKDKSIHEKSREFIFGHFECSKKIQIDGGLW